jgi:hypothetical protein
MYYHMTVVLRHPKQSKLTLDQFASLRKELMDRGFIDRADANGHITGATRTPSHTVGLSRELPELSIEPKKTAIGMFHLDGEIHPDHAMVSAGLSLTITPALFRVLRAVFVGKSIRDPEPFSDLRLVVFDLTVPTHSFAQFEDADN